MNNEIQFENLRDIIKYAQKAMLEIHKDQNIYAKNVVMCFSTAKIVFESLKEQIPNV